MSPFQEKLKNRIAQKLGPAEDTAVSVKIMYRMRCELMNYMSVESAEKIVSSMKVSPNIRTANAEDIEITAMVQAHYLLRQLSQFREAGFTRPGEALANAAQHLTLEL